EADELTSLCRRGLRLSRHLRVAAQGARWGAAPPPLPGYPAGPLRNGRRRAREERDRGRRPRRGGKAVRARPRVGPRAEPGAASSLSGIVGVPDRPLSRQGASAEPSLLPVRELLPGADLESQLRGR